MKYRHAISLAFIVMLLCPSPLQAEGDSLQWDFTDLFQGTKENPALPSSLEGWKEHLDLFGKNIPPRESRSRRISVMEEAREMPAPMR